MHAQTRFGHRRLIPSWLLTPVALMHLNLSQPRTPDTKGIIWSIQLTSDVLKITSLASFGHLCLASAFRPARILALLLCPCCPPQSQPCNPHHKAHYVHHKATKSMLSTTKPTMSTTKPALQSTTRPSSRCNYPCCLPQDHPFALQYSCPSRHDGTSSTTAASLYH